MELDKIKKVYVIGIKGSGVIAMVEILHSMGIEISGSDTEEKFFTDSILERLGIKYVEGFNEKNIPNDIDLVIYSTAYNENNNPEFKLAKEKGVVMMSYPEILAKMFNEKYGLAVCGTHGKTTTAAWLAHALKTAGADPSAAIGSKVSNWGGNALAGKGEYFVAETDEYQNKLELYDPKGVIFTSCDWDHPDYFQNFEEYKKAFENFVKKITKTGFLVVWGDSVDTLEVAKKATSKVFKYGFNEDNDIQIKLVDSRIKNEIAQKLEVDREEMQIFCVFHGSQLLGKFEIKLFGKHNILNATAVITACYLLNIDMKKVAEGIRNFEGTARRFEYIGQRNGAVLIDDYGHHPEEIKATLSAARQKYPEKNIWTIFHPHTFTRTKALLEEFAQSFDDADHVMILDIYGSAREIQGGVHSEDLVNLINKYNRQKAEYVPKIPQAVEILKDKITSSDVVISIGAGNGWEVVEKLKEK